MPLPAPVVQIIEVIGPAEQGKSIPFLCSGSDGHRYYVKGQQTAPACGVSGFALTLDTHWACRCPHLRWFSLIRRCARNCPGSSRPLARSRRSAPAHNRTPPGWNWASASAYLRHCSAMCWCLTGGCATPTVCVATQTCCGTPRTKSWWSLITTWRWTKISTRQNFWISMCLLNSGSHWLRIW